MNDFELRAGNFSEDARGRWYLNVCVPAAQRAGGERNKPSVESILDRSIPSIGIDLGLREFAAFSDVSMPAIEAKRFYRDLEPKLSKAQRARKKQGTRAIHAKIANRRKDSLHKLSTRLVKANGASRTGPKGREGLGIGGWQCSICGAIHDRNVNAAQIILAAGHRRLAEGISVL